MAFNVPCTTTSAGFSGPADCTEIVAAWAYPAESTPQTRIASRIERSMSGTGPGGESLTPATTSDQRSNDVATLRRVRTLRILEPLGARFGVCLAFRRNAMLKERRQHQRHSINRVAKIQSAGSLPRDCLIADISEGGGRLYAEGNGVP